MNTVNPINTWTERLSERPEIFPHQLNLVNDSVLLVNLSASEIRAASFLDQRVLKPAMKGQWVPWATVVNQFREAPKNRFPAYLFHVGHCGSTLVSRLLEFAVDTQCLREPLPLRILAQDVADYDDGRSFLDRPAQRKRLELLSRMWGRGARHTVIKATSICTGLLPHIRSQESVAKSAFIYNCAETHLATLLAGQNALTDLRGFAQLRLQRLQKITSLDTRLSQMTPGQLAALSWLSETSVINRSLEKYPGQIALVEFESFLQAPAENLARLFHHFDIAASHETVEKAVCSSVLQTYSKAPEHKYNAETRAAILEDSRSRFGQEIRAGLAWLEKLASQSETITGVMQKFAQAKAI